MAESGGSRSGAREGEEGRQGCGGEGVGKALYILNSTLAYREGNFAFCWKMGGRGRRVGRRGGLPSEDQG